MNKSFTLIGLFMLALFLLIGWGQHNQVIASSESTANIDIPPINNTNTIHSSTEPLPARSETGIEIRLQQAVFDPLQGPPTLPPTLTAAAQPTPATNYYLVQFEGPIQTEWRANIERQGGLIMDYVPDFAYIVKMDQAQLAQIQTMASIRWVGVYQPAFRLSNQLIAGLANAQPDVAADLVVRSFAGEPAASLMPELAGLGIEIVSQADDHGGGLIYRVRAPETAVVDLAHIPAVAWIEPYIEPTLHNEIARSDLAMNQDEIEQVLGLYGQNQMVAVGDTGLSTGNPATVHQDFTGRVVGGTWGPGNCGTWGDNHSHGTHVAGSVLGSGFHSGADIPNQVYTGSNAGIAPEALLYVWSFCNNFSGLPNAPYNDYYGVMYGIDSRLRINTNSWGYTTNHGQYNTFTRETDRFVWDHPDMVLVYAAGNAGTDGNSDGVVDLFSMAMPSTAKNVITVGASENYRLTGGLNPGGFCSTWGNCWPADYPANPINSDRISDNVDGMAAFSGRGPVLDGRLKPDVVAPGTNIVSARNESVGTGWGIYDAHYLYMGGTSMATPLVAGASAVVREFYTTTYGIDPSAALVKASLINGAYDMTPGQYGAGSTQDVTNRPDDNQGWGRVDLPNTLIYEAGRELWYHEHAGLDTGDSYQMTLVVISDTIPLRATLVWVDYYGTEASFGALVNDLDLEVEAPDGTIYLGNEILTGGTPDRTNNVEGVDLMPLAGTYTVTVHAFNIPQGPQPFALVVTAGTEAEEVGYLTGVVDDGTDPIEGATVTADDGTSSLMTTTDSSGSYTLTLAVGSYDVTAEAVGYAPVTVTGVTISTDTTTVQNFSLTALPTYTVAGTVTDAATGWPLYAQIEIQGSPYTIWTDPVDGSYTVSLLAGTQYEFVVDAWVDGYETASRTVGPLTGNGTEDFALDVDPSCSAPGYTPACDPTAGSLVVGNVYDENTGAGLPGAMVSGDSGEMAMAMATPDDPNVDDGFYTIFAPEGSNVLTATHTGAYGSDSAMLTVGDGDTIHQDFWLPAGWLQANPSMVVVNVLTGTMTTVPLNLHNLGGIDANFEIQERNGGYSPLLLNNGYVPEPRAQLAGYDSLAMTTEGLFAPQERPAFGGILAAGDVLDSWPSGHTLPWGTGFNLDDGMVWVNDNAAGGGTGLNEEFTVDGTLTGNNFTPSFGGSWPGDMAYNTDTGMFWQVNVGGDNCIYEWDPTIPAATGNSICGAGWTSTSQRGLAYNSDAETFFIGGWNDANVYEIDATGATVATCTMNLGISGLAYNWEAGLLFAMLNASVNTIEVIDWPTCSVVDSITVEGGAFGSFSGAGMGIDCDGNLWAANQLDEDIYLIDSGVPSSLCSSDIPWLSEDPITGTVAANSTEVIDLTFDASVPEVDALGVYTGSLRFNNNTVYGYFDVPVTMRVVDTIYGVELDPAAASAADDAGESVSYTLTITNTGTESDTFALMLSGNAWDSDLSTASVTLAAGASTTFMVTVHIPAGLIGPGHSDMVTVTAESTNDPFDEAMAESVLTTEANEIYRLYLPLIMRP